MGNCCSGAKSARNHASFGEEYTIRSKYTIGREIGRGHFAKVKLGVAKQTGIEYAVKIIDKMTLKNPQVLRDEVSILKKIGQHENVISLEEVFEDEKFFYLVTEYCSGGDLFTKIVDEGKSSEKQAVDFLIQIAQALIYIHKAGITHRDLKPENIMLSSKLPNARIKLGDFGLAKSLGSRQALMNTVCGTWAYCAPEVLSRKPYDHRVDNWTVGVLMYILLCGYHCFDVYGDLPVPQLIHNIKMCRYDFNDEAWNDVSPEAKDIIRSLLQVDPRKRLSLEAFLSHPYVQHHGSDKQLPKVLGRLQSFNITRRHGRQASIMHARGSLKSMQDGRSHNRHPSTPSIQFGGKGPNHPVVEVMDFQAFRKEIQNALEDPALLQEQTQFSDEAKAAAIPPYARPAQQH